MPRLDALQRRYAEEGVTVVAVAWRDDARAVRRFVAQHKADLGFRVAFDGDGSIAEAYLAAAGVDEVPHAFVFDARDGEPRLAWHGLPERGLEAAVGDVLDGLFDLGVARAIAHRERDLREAWRDKDSDVLLAAVDELLGHRPDALAPWLWRIEVLSRLRRDPAATCAAVARALKAMAGSPKRTLRFCQQLVALPGLDADSLRAAAAALRPLGSGAFSEPGAPLCEWQALDRAGDTDTAADAADRALAAMAGHPAWLADLGQCLAASEHAQAYVDTAVAALDAALPNRPDSRDLRRAKLQVLVSAHRDAAAIEAGKAVVAALGDDLDALNEFTWDLVDDADLRARFAALALAGAEAMERAGNALPAHCLDTVAAAKFSAGAVDAAIAAQQRALAALEKGDPQRAEFEARLAQYRAAKR